MRAKRRAGAVCNSRSAARQWGVDDAVDPAIDHDRDRVIVAEASVHRAGRRQPQSVAGRAEVLRHRRDHSESTRERRRRSRRLGQTKIAGRSGAMRVAPGVLDHARRRMISAIRARIWAAVRQVPGR